jgi:hypothetical protein
MVEVDVFWSYGIGASFALAAFRQLRQLQAESGENDRKYDLKEMLDVKTMVKELEKGDSTAFDNQYFRKTLLFLSLLFVPSGANLLWSNPNWETMQVGRYETIPGWLVSAFSITNVSQGILGFWTTWNLLMRGKYYRAGMQTIGAYVGFWFILVNGWDKTGYQRFFSKNREAFDDWKWTNVFGWLFSDVVRILLAYGAAFIPLMLYWITKWLEEGYKTEGLEVPEDQTERLTETAKLAANLLTAVFGVGLGSAVFAHLMIRWFGWTIGGSIASAALYLGVVRRNGIGPALLKKILKVDAMEGPPVWELIPAERQEEEELVEIGA